MLLGHLEFFAVKWIVRNGRKAVALTELNLR